MNTYNAVLNKSTLPNNSTVDVVSWTDSFVNYRVTCPAGRTEDFQVCKHTGDIDKVKLEDSMVWGS